MNYIELYHLDPWVTGISAHQALHWTSPGSTLLPSLWRLRYGKTMASNWAHRNNKNRSQKINRQSVKQNVSRKHFVKHQFSDSTGSREILQETPAKLGFCCQSKSAKPVRSSAVSRHLLSWGSGLIFRTKCLSLFRWENRYPAIWERVKLLTQPQPPSPHSAFAILPGRDPRLEKSGFQDGHHLSQHKKIPESIPVVLMLSVWQCMMCV